MANIYHFLKKIYKILMIEKLEAFQKLYFKIKPIKINQSLKFFMFLKIILDSR